VIDVLSNHFEVLPATPAAYPWMIACFHKQIQRIDGGPHELAHSQRDALARILRGGLGSAVVASPIGFPEEEGGFAVALGGALLFAYVRNDFRRQGIARKMLQALTLRTPVEAAYWTPEAEAIAAHGFPLRYDINAYRSLLAFVREPRRPAQWQLIERTA
jgi:GNAT superfamily N-acetyltransferase